MIAIRIKFTFDELQALERLIGQHVSDNHLVELTDIEKVIWFTLFFLQQRLWKATVLKFNKTKTISFSPQEAYALRNWIPGINPSDVWTQNTLRLLLAHIDKKLI